MMSKLIESKFYEKERKYIDEAYSVLLRKIDPNEIYVVGSTAGKVYLDDKNGFLKTTIFPVSKDLDLLINNKNANILRQILTETSTPLYKTIYRRDGFEELYLPFQNYVLNESVDVFIDGVCAIPTTENAYKIEGNVVYKGLSLNAPEKSFIFATYINPLAITPNRLERFFILAVDEYVQNGEEILKTKVDGTVYYVALGSKRVEEKTVELQINYPNHPILFEKDFIHYNEQFKKISNLIENEIRKLVRKAKLSGFQEDTAERTARIIQEKIKNEYEVALKEVKR